MALEPKILAKPQMRISFNMGSIAGEDFGHLFRNCEFKGMVNGGYIVRVKLFDAHYNFLTKLIDEGYLEETRTKPVTIKFQLLQGPDGKFPETATRSQTAVVMSLQAIGGPADIANVELIAIDPPSWYLNRGDASGLSFKGRVDQVVKQVVEFYAPGINVEVGRTTDSEYNRWWMMRQDPKTFLSSLADWSSAITQRKTQWLFQMDGERLIIKEQGAMPSKQRGFYRYFSGGIDTIRSVDIKADNALSLVQSMLVTAGTAAVSGHYLDRITDPRKRKVYVKDSTTSDKQIARVNSEQSFTKPEESYNSVAGWSAVTSIPEPYSAGDLGLQYDDYIDGRARGMWLNMTNALLRACFRVIGHGEWSSTEGLGVDTVFIKWTAGRRAEGKEYWWASGTWLVYGFHHVVSLGEWYTDLYCSRFDHDAAAKKVGG